MFDKALNMKPGINFCAPTRKLGFRGVSDGTARLIPLQSKESQDKEIFFFHGVNVLVNMLPYIPDMGEGSNFINEGHWHYYKICNGIFIVFLIPKSDKETSIYNKEWVFQSVLFNGEKKPRVFLNRINELVSRSLINRKEIDDLLERKNITLI